MTTLPGPGESTSTPITEGLVTIPTGVSKHTNLATPLRSDALDELPLDDLYDERLQEIWKVAVGRPLDLTIESDALLWEGIRSAVVDAGFVADLRRAELERLTAPRADQESIPGDAATVNLTVGTIAEQMSPGQRRQFFRGQFALTVDRLEKGGATREDVTDIIIRALRPEAGNPGVSVVVRRLLGYLTGQLVKRDANYYLSAAMCGDILSRDDDPKAQLAAVVAYSYVVHGMWQLARERPDDFIGINRRVPSDSLSNLALRVEAQATAGGRATDVVHDLVRLSAVTAETPPIDPNSVRDHLADLGFHSEEPADTLAVLRILGGRGAAWRPDPPTQAVLECAGAVATLVTGRSDLVPSRLFNAGVSLLLTPGGRNEAGARARLAVNGLGIFWGFSGAEGLDSVTAATFSCAVNFMGAATEFHEHAGDSSSWSALLPTVRAVAGLSALTSAVEHNARLVESARSLNLGPLEAPEPARLSELLATALDLLSDDADPRSGRWAAAATAPELVRLTSATIGGITRRLVGLPVTEIASDVASVVADRSRAREAFIEGFADYATPPPDVPGQGPLVVAGLVDLQTWVQEATRLLQDPGTMVPELERFTN